MSRALVLIGVASALTLSGFSAQAGCTNPLTKGAPHTVSPMVMQLLSKHLPSGNGGRTIIGTWLVSYTVNDQPAGQAFIQWHNDGTEWENINFPIMGGNICMGSWKHVNSESVYRSHVGWLYTDGNLSGYFTETETDKITGNGTYAGNNDTKIYDLDGNLLTEFAGTASAVRISP